MKKIASFQKKFDCLVFDVDDDVAVDDEDGVVGVVGVVQVEWLFGWCF